MTDVVGGAEVTVYSTTTHAQLWFAGLDGSGSNGLTISADGTKAYATFAHGPAQGGLMIFDLTNPTNVGRVSMIDPLFDVAVTPNGAQVYALDWPPNATTGKVAVIDPVTKVVLKYIVLSVLPWDLVFSPDGSKAYVVGADNSGNGAGSIEVIDVATGTVTATIPIGAASDGIAISPDGSTLFATNPGDGSTSGTVSVVSTATNTVTSTILNVGFAPFHIRVSPDGTQAWLLNLESKTVAVIDLASKSVVFTYAVSGGTPWNLAFTPDGKQVWVTVDGSDANATGTMDIFDVASATWNPTVTRVSGADRYLTSVKVAQAAFPTTAPVVFIATGTGFADALSAAAPAAKLGGPLLLTDPANLPTTTKQEIQSLQPSTIYIVGGTGAVSTAVENQLRLLAATVTRLAGTDRFDTGRKVVDVAFASMQKVYVATGLDFPDALSASAAAGAAGIPVLLVNGSKPTLDTPTSDFLTSHGANAFTVIGGPSVVSAGIATQLGTSGPVNRIYGVDRYTTSQLINADAFTSGTSAYFATGTQFADALSGAVLAAVNHSPLYVVNPTCVPRGSEHDLAARGVSNVTLIGGTGALSAAVAKLHNC
ncbi:cell wall-binding repeat-containing protein [Diaminobutyricibacter sp. McL0618]|uniref:cell wall-binding repeat-containing protein n=1 Tax=Leifsonia sp. McL0618 TaxID=3415677 RepID=UPI003CE7A913